MIRLCSKVRAWTAGAALLLLAGQTANAASFTLSPGSPSLALGPFTPSDIFVAPGPLGGPPALAIPGALLGLGPADNIDAMAWGPQVPIAPVLFSVDLGAAGAPGTAVVVESLAGQQAGDVYLGAGFGGNGLFLNQDAAGLFPAIAPAAPFPGPPPIDDIDSLELNPPALLGPAVPLIFSVDPLSPLLGAFPGTGPGDLFVTVPGAGPPALFIPFGALGLVAGDDIDALIFDPAGLLPPFISLAPGSPSLGALGLSPGDIVAGVAGLPFVLPAGALGLLPGDNLNAATTVVPLPASAWLLAGALGTLCVCRRRLAPR